MSAKLVKFIFTQGQKQAWLDWSKELQRRKDEVIQTLKNEGVISEACFISEDGESVYYYMEAADFEKVKKSVQESPFPIDLEHKEICGASLEFVEELKPLFYFKSE